MGIFDTYIVPCPHCNSLVEQQKKPGFMETFVFGKDPKRDILFEGFYTCYTCLKDFTVEYETMPKMIVRKGE